MKKNRKDVKKKKQKAKGANGEKFKQVATAVSSFLFLKPLNVILDLLACVESMNIND